MGYDLQPNLKGELIELRPLRADDFESLYGVASDPLVWEQHPQPDRCKREVFEKFFVDAMASRGAFAVIDVATCSVLGSSRYYDLDEVRGEVAIGYTFLARKVWGSGHNREMKSLMLKHAFRFVRTVLFHIGENNIRSQKAVEKIGARLCGRIEKDQELPGGNLWTSLVYKIESSSY
jgi:RimJ/RimL family protein N-acetyltransferase